MYEEQIQHVINVLAFPVSLKKIKGGAYEDVV
jgi:hypothetical protein